MRSAHLACPQGRRERCSQRSKRRSEGHRQGIFFTYGPATGHQPTGVLASVSTPVVPISPPVPRHTAIGKTALIIGSLAGGVAAVLVSVDVLHQVHASRVRLDSDARCTGPGSCRPDRHRDGNFPRPRVGVRGDAGRGKGASSPENVDNVADSRIITIPHYWFSAEHLWGGALGCGS